MKCGDSPAGKSRRSWALLEFGLALFGKKKGDSQTQAEAETGGAGTSNGRVVEPRPEKAAAFFDRAKTVHDSTNYEYAMTLWLQGIRLDPTNVKALESFYASGCEFASKQAKKKGPTKGQRENFSGKGPLERYLQSLLEFGADPLNWQAGLKAAQQAAKLDLKEPALALGKKVLGLAYDDPRTKKDHFVAMMNLFQDIEAFDLATKSGESAIAKDPTDSKLEAEVKNMSAQAAIQRGGLRDSARTAGGFRKGIRDADRQRSLEQEESAVRSETTAQQIIDRAREEYESRPQDINTIKKYQKQLLARGTPEDEKIAYNVLTKGYKETNAYELKKLASDIKLRAARRKVRQLKEAAQADPSNEELARKAASAHQQLLEAEAKEYAEHVEAYPTDLNLKYELGLRLFRLERYEEAIQLFQAAKDSPGVADRAKTYLAQAFAKIGWYDEAEATFRDALESHENPNDDLGLALRYGLMDALEHKAREFKDVPAADEAFKLASGIAVQQIDYRDIRARRQGLQELVKELKSAQ